MTVESWLVLVYYLAVVTSAIPCVLSQIHFQPMARKIDILLSSLCWLLDLMEVVGSEMRECIWNLLFLGFIAICFTTLHDAMVN